MPGRRACIVVAVTAAALVLPTLAAARDRTYVLMGDFPDPASVWHQQLQRPLRFRVNSSDSHVVFSHLRWRGWGTDRATAAGRATTCDYLRGCDSAPVTLTATRRRSCGQDAYYRRMTASRVPNYGDGPLALPVGRPDCGLPPGCAVRFGPGPQDVAPITGRVHVSCAAAERVVGDFMSGRVIDRKRHRVDGWKCRWLPPGGPSPTCARGARRRIRFVTD